MSETVSIDGQTIPVISEEQSNGNGLSPSSHKYNDDASPFPLFGLSNHPEDLYKHIGFQIAIHSQECPLKYFTDFMEEHAKNKNEEIDELKRITQFNIDRYKTKIATAKSEFDEERMRLKTQIPGIAELLVEEKKIEEDLDVSKKELIEKLQIFFQAKEGLLKQKTDTIKNELETIVIEEKRAYQERNDIQKQLIQEQSDNYNEKLKWLKSLKGTLTIRYDEIQGEIKRNDLRGVGPALFNFLIALGTTGAVVAGWFFSVFITTDPSEQHGKLDFDNMAITQLIGRLINFSGTHDWFVSLGILLGFLLLVLGISWGMYEIEKRLPKEKNDADLDAEWEWSRAGIHPINSTIKGKSWFAFWLKSTPWIFVIGAMLILMAVGGADSRFSGTLTGESIGFLLSIALSGVAYIYVSNSTQAGSSAVNSTKSKVIYLAIGFILFNLIVGVALLFSNYFINTVGFGFFKQFYALVNFVLIMSITALIVAFGIYYKGIVRISSFLNWKINNVDEQIRKASGIDKIQDIATENDNISSEVRNRIKDLVLAKQAEVLSNLNSDSRVAMFISPSNPENTRYPCLSDADARLFPEHDIIIRAKIMHCEDLKRQAGTIESEIKAIQEQQTRNLETTVVLLDLYNNRLHQWNNEIIWAELDLIERLSKERIRLMWEQAQLKDGYHLGMIYRNHDAIGIPGYYYPCMETQ